MTRLAAFLCPFRDVGVGYERSGGYGEVDEMTVVDLGHEVLDKRKGQKVFRFGYDCQLYTLDQPTESYSSMP